MQDNGEYMKNTNIVNAMSGYMQSVEAIRGVWPKPSPEPIPLKEILENRISIMGADLYDLKKAYAELSSWRDTLEETVNTILKGDGGMAGEEAVEKILDELNLLKSNTSFILGVMGKKLEAVTTGQKQIRASLKRYASRINKLEKEVYRD